MYYLALLVPVIITFGFYLYKKHEFTWWEFFIPILGVAVVIFVTKLCIDSASVNFSEYWGSTVTAVYEQEPYNYWHHETCSRSVSCGTDSKGNTKYCTEYYDCSHQDDVSPKWWAVTNIGENISISEKLHDELKLQFGTNRTIVETHDNYDEDDECVGSNGTKFQGKKVGDKSYVYETKWDGSENKRKPYVSKHSYVNKVKASDLSIFNLKIISEKDADSLKLFKYPECANNNWFEDGNGFEYPTILGGNVSKKTQENFKRLNGKFGATNKLRLWILVFENKPISIATMQENYWVKGNKNELVLCIGKKGNEIQWSYAFSWSKSTILTAEIKNYIMELYQYKDTVIKKKIPPMILPLDKINDKKIDKIKNVVPKELKKVAKSLKNNTILPIKNDTTYIDTIVKVKSSNYPVLTEQTWNNLYQYLDNNLHKFEKRSFKEFNYLTVEPSNGAIWLIFILAIIFSIGINIYVISNEFSSDDDNNDTSYNGWRY